MRNVLIRPTFGRIYLVKKLLLAILLITSSVSMSFSKATMNTMNTRAKFKSLFIYNFTKLTEWPESYKQGDFIIGVVNDVDLAEQIELAAKTKKINSQNVVIKNINSTADVSKCHVLYVSGSTAGEVDPFIKKAKDFNCLIIT